MAPPPMAFPMAHDPPAPSRDDPEQTLDELRAQRLVLARELGVTDSHAIVAMVRSLEAQLADLYALHARPPLTDRQTAEMIDRVQSLAVALGRIDAEKAITLELEGDRLRLRATWHQPSAQQGERP